MFKSNNQNVYISSKSQSVKPDVVSDVQAQDQIRLLVPSFISFLDPNETYLKLDLQINNPSVLSLITEVVDAYATLAVDELNPVIDNDFDVDILISSSKMERRSDGRTQMGAQRCSMR